MATPAFLYRLLQTRGFVGPKGPEDAEALKFGLTLRAAAIELRLKCIFCHPPLELMRKKPQCALAAAMGAVEGTSDFLLLARDGSMAIEFKSTKGQQRPLQRDFQAWCDLIGVPYHIARSAEQGLALVRDQGWLA